MHKFYTSKNFILLITFAFFCLLVNQSISSASGPPTGYTSAPGESNCTSCHSGVGINSGKYGSSFQITSNMPNGHYAFNTTYQIKVKLATKNCVKYGFELVALNTSNANIGSFATTDSRTQRVISGSKQYMMQTSTGTSSVYTDSTEWNFNWTSPISNAGNVIFYMNGNVTNNNSSDVGDTIYSTSFTFPPYTPPTGAIGATSSNICENDSIRFTASGSNTPTGFAWTFPGGTPATSTAQVQWVKFANAASAVCSLYVSNSSGTSPLVTKTITINTYPTASITPTGSSTFCQGDSVLLTGNSGTNYTYLWLLDGVSTGLTSNAVYAKAGGAYTLKVTNNGACSVTSSAVGVTVNPKPLPVLSNTGSLAFCSGDSVLLKVSGASVATRQWFNGSTLLNGITDTVYYAKSAGTYSVNVINAALCATVSNSLNVTVNTYPTAFFTSTPSGCIFILTANGGAGYQYQWFKNDTAIVNDTSINHTLNENGVYKVRVTNSGGCSVFSGSQTMNVTNLPDVTLTVAGNTIFCTGDSCRLSVPLNNSFTYRWFKNNIQLPNDTLNTILLKDSGVYLVKVSNITCTNISNTKNIVMLNYPDAGITASNTAICQGDSALMNAKTGAGYSYKWFKNDTLIAGQNSSSLKVKDAGSYMVNISNGSCNKDGNKISLKVSALPAVPLISRDKQTLTSTSALAYQWFKNDTLIASANSRSYTPIADGKYKVTVTDSNGCSNTSANYNYALTGFTNSMHNFDFNIFPSPANDYIIIETAQPDCEISILNILGDCVYHKTHASSRIQIDASQWSNGIYFVYGVSDGVKAVKKIVVSR